MVDDTRCCSSHYEATPKVRYAFYDSNRFVNSLNSVFKRRDNRKTLSKTEGRYRAFHIIHIVSFHSSFHRRVFEFAQIDSCTQELNVNLSLSLWETSLAVNSIGCVRHFFPTQNQKIKKSCNKKLLFAKKIVKKSKKKALPLGYWYRVW